MQSSTDFEIYADILAKKEYCKKLYAGFIQAQALANIGHWEFDLVANTLYWSDEVYRIFGLEPRELCVAYEVFLQHVYPDDCSIVAAVIAMANSLGKDVIAEGSETKEHIEALKSLHCFKAQGYYFSKPLKIEAFREYVTNFKL